MQEQLKKLNLIKKIKLIKLKEKLKEHNDKPKRYM